MLAPEVCKLDALSTQNAQELVLPPQGCSCAPAQSPMASPDRDLCEVEWHRRGSTGRRKVCLPPAWGGEALGFCGKAQQLPNLVSLHWLLFFLAFKHKVEVVTCSAAALTCMKYAVNILPHLSHSTPEKCLHLPRLEHGGSAGWVDRCSAHQPLW